MSRTGILLVGAGKHAHACIDVIEQQGKFEITGLVGEPDQLNAQSLGYRVIATDAKLARLLEQCRNALITVGQISSPGTRMRLYERCTTLGFEFPAIISPNAYVSKHAGVGAGTIVMHGAVINAGATVGNNCIVNTRALIEHDARVEAHCHVSTGAVVNGSCRIGSGSFIGSGSVIRDGITLGRNCTVGMGLSVRHHQADNSLFTGHDKQ